MPGEFVIWTDLNSKMLRGCMSVILFSFVVSETVSIFLVYSILSTLRKNSSTFSKNTYKLNRQLTLLLAFQVRSLYYSVSMSEITKLFQSWQIKKQQLLRTMLKTLIFYFYSSQLHFYSSFFPFLLVYFQYFLATIWHLQIRPKSHLFSSLHMV